MKKKIANILAIALAAGMLVGCGKEDASKALKDMDVEKYVTLGEYNGLEIAVDPIAVSDSEVEELVAGAYNNYVTAEHGITDRAVAVGDAVNIDYVGKKDEVAFEGGTAQGAVLAIGSGQFIDGFEEGLVNVQPGETVDLNLTFPEYYDNAELAGADVVFTVTVNFILPAERVDAVVAGMGIEGVSTVEELEQYAYDYLYSMEEYSYQTGIQNKVLSAFMSNCVFEEIPQQLSDRYRELVNENLSRQAAAYNIDAATFVSYFYNMELEAFLDEYCIEAAKQDLALQAVANRENLNPTEEELNTSLQEYVVNAGYSSVEEYLSENSEEAYRDYMACEKALNFIVDNALINENVQ